MGIEQEFTSVPSVVDRGISAILYADPNAGKTTILSKLPEKKTLVILAEGGYGPLIGSGHVVFDIVKVAEQKYNGDIFKCLDELYQYLRTSGHQFDWVCLDNISELEQLFIGHLTTRRRKEFTEVKEYGDSACRLRQVIHDFRDLTLKGINVVITAWEFPITLKNIEGVVVTKVYPKISQKIAVEMCGIYDIAAHVEVEEKTEERWLRIGPSDQYATKCQFGGVETRGEVPDLDILFTKIRDHYVKENVKQKKGK